MLREAIIRVALVHSFYSSATPSGENRAVEAEAQALSRAGHDVRVLAVRTDDLEIEPLYPLRSGLRVASGFGRSPIPEIERYGADVVHIHNLFPNIGSRWVLRERRPVVATLHNFRSICANGLLLRDGRVCTLCPDGRRFAGVRHRCYRGSAVATLPVAVANAAGPERQPVVRKASRLIVLSNVAKDIFTAAGIPTEKMTVWPNFVPLAQDPGAASSERRDQWLYVGRLGPEKGIERLVRSWPADTRLLVVGDGTDADRIQSAAAGKAVELLGSRRHEDVRSLMSESSGLVFPSVCLENFPMVYAEALAAGLPVVAWRPNTVAGFVERDGTGIATDWSHELSEVLGRANRTFPSLRERCRRVFEEKYSERAYVRRAIDLYEAVTAA